MMVGWFMVFNATFNSFELYLGGQFYWWRKLEKTTDLSPVTNKLLSHNVLPRMSRVRTHVSGDRH